jgi:ATP-dependent 26S proteasome regulatory subunit
MRPGRLDRKIEFSLPDLEVGKQFYMRKGILEVFSSCDVFHFNICQFFDF